MNVCTSYYSGSNAEMKGSYLDNEGNLTGWRKTLTLGSRDSGVSFSAPSTALNIDVPAPSTTGLTNRSDLPVRPQSPPGFDMQYRSRSIYFRI